jgi:Zn-finger nucleic acid-binding protein
MATCAFCSAPLPSNTLTCTYCGARNDVDLALVHEYTIVKPESDRPCPRCSVPMQTIDLAIGGRFYIERCGRCLGLFFDPNELQTVLDTTVTNVYEVNVARLNELDAERMETNEQIRYVKCPVCRQLMNRVNFGHRSGVIIDQCRDHGIWLDGGELRRLLEWRKAGGQLLHERIQKENLEIEERRAQEREARARAEKEFSRYEGSLFSDRRERGELFSENTTANALTAIARFFLK